jgi:organic radical activating enzyme
MERVKIPEPISGGLILSYQCTAECRYCMYACSPKWKGWISEEDLKRILNQLAERIQPSRYGSEHIELNYGLHFTGGEPFLQYELLLKAVEIANELGIPSTFVETNSYWCTSDQASKEKLNLLKAKGLKGTLISVNPYYLEYVPFERTERGIKISQEVFGEGNVMIYQRGYREVFKKLGIKGRISLEDYLNLVKGEDWNYLPGYCGGISLGDCRNLDLICKEGIDVDNHPILKFLIGADFEGLLKFAQNFGYNEKLEGYVSKCHLCLDIRRYLAKEGFAELEPKEFYSHLE